jgi:hypothetical protein
MASIRLIASWNDEHLFVPGNDPARIIADGNEFLVSDEARTTGLADGLIVITPQGKVRVSWYRVNPCSPSTCGDFHNGHWTETPERTRGGFQGAMIAFGWAGES